nr:MAG TPA: hypothetical protein [Caudoviricetes sp.]
MIISWTCSILYSLPLICPPIHKKSLSRKLKCLI